ncbi:MAG: hypothetical protein NTW17_01345 [Candidatus Pacearchaeota archaeon]|nr:hypothetical protein [Candidatus Pacearchaeota archaeon]
MVQDTTEIKEKIISLMQIKGPSLPVHVSSEIKTSILFASAFLSELISEKRIKISNMRVGSSPLYFLPGQELMLEKFSQYLKSREKEAFMLLKEKRFLKDSVQAPAIRVALREIRDFAIPFKNKDEIFWRYFQIPESELDIQEIKEEKIVPIETKKEAEVPSEKPLIILEKKEKPKRKPKKSSPKKTSNKDDKFFASIKTFLSENSIELIDIESFGKKEIALKVRENGEDKLLVAYNKNKISGEDIIKASKRASEKKLKYIILGLGGPLKKLDSLIEALKGLSSIKKVNKNL